MGGKTALVYFGQQDDDKSREDANATKPEK
jgi:hypothetical protein